jgi:hypothetical protein
MATYNIEKKKDRVTVEVTVAGLPAGPGADKHKEVVRPRNVRSYLEGQHIKVGECLESTTLCNYDGSPQTGTFVFLLKGAEVPVEKKVNKENKIEEKATKDLTTPDESVIMEDRLKKRKRVKNDFKTGTDTTS